MATSIKRREQARRVAAQRARSKSHKPRRTAAKLAKSRGPTPKAIVIDVHAHVLVPEVMKRTFEHLQYARAVAGNMPEPLFQRMTEVPLRLREMDATGVDVQVISPSIMQQCSYGFEPQEALELDRRSNDRVAEIVAQHKDRLIGLRSRPPSSSAACATSVCAASSFHLTSTGPSWATRACGRSGARRKNSVPSSSSIPSAARKSACSAIG